MFQRPDDNEATVAERLRVYDEKTRPLIEFYRDQGILRTIEAEGELDEVTQRLEMALESVSAPAAFAKSDAPKPARKRAVVKKKRAPAGKKTAVKKTAAKKKSAAAKKVAGKKSAAKKKAARKKSGGAKPRRKR